MTDTGQLPEPAATAPGRAAREAFWDLYPGTGMISDAVFEAAAQAAIDAGNAEPPAVRISACPLDSHDAEHVQVRTGNAWLCGQLLGDLLAANGVHVAARLAEGNERLRRERDSLTGRVAELVTEGNELRGQLADAHSETRSFLARMDALARELEALSARHAPGARSEAEAAIAKRLRAITCTDPVIDPPASSSPDGGGGQDGAEG